LASVSSLSCSRRSFTATAIRLQYEYDHVYYVFGLLRSRKYLLLCDVCSRGETLDRSEFERALERVPVPFMHRFGCVVFVGLVLLLALVMAALD